MPTFPVALDSAVTMTPKYGHMACFSPSCSSPISHVPLVWPEGLWGGDLFLLCLIHLYVLPGFKHRPGPTEAPLWGNLEVQKQRRQAPQLWGRGAGPLGPSWRRLQSWNYSQWGREEGRKNEGENPFDCWRVSHMPYTSKGNGRMWLKHFISY